MNTYFIPPAPDVLHVSIDHYWSGQEASPLHHAYAWISKSSDGLLVKVEALIQTPQRAPEAPPGTRVDGLWNFDVVELFLVGENGAYLEVELGAKGHWLILGFDLPRHRSREYADIKPQFEHVRDEENRTWTSRIVIPWDIVPQPLSRMNAFAISGEPVPEAPILDGRHYLALSPTPGSRPDFHQPREYPPATLAS